MSNNASEEMSDDVSDADDGQIPSGSSSRRTQPEVKLTRAPAATRPGGGTGYGSSAQACTTTFVFVVLVGIGLMSGAPGLGGPMNATTKFPTTTTKFPTTGNHTRRRECYSADGFGPPDSGFRAGRGMDYRGRAYNSTRSGRACLPWRVGGHNYCRNPTYDRNEGPWCYVDYDDYDDDASWEYCDVPRCQSSSDDDGPWSIYDDLKSLIIEMDGVDSPLLGSSVGASWRDLAPSLKSTVSAVSALATPCGLVDVDVVVPNTTLLLPMRRRRDDGDHAQQVQHLLSKSSHFQSFRETTPEYVLEFLRDRLPDAVREGSVTLGVSRRVWRLDEDEYLFRWIFDDDDDDDVYDDDDDADSDDSSEDIDLIRETYASLVRCAANAIPKRVVGSVGHNGLYHLSGDRGGGRGGGGGGTDDPEDVADAFSAVVNPALFSYDNIREIAEHVEKRFGTESRRAFHRVACEITDYGAKSVESAFRARLERAAVAQRRAGLRRRVYSDAFVSLFTKLISAFGSVGESECADYKRQFVAAKANSSDSAAAAATAGSSSVDDSTDKLNSNGSALPLFLQGLGYTSGRRFSTLIPLSVFTGFIVLLVISTVGRMEFITARETDDDADSKGDFIEGFLRGRDAYDGDGYDQVVSAEYADDADSNASLKKSLGIGGGISGGTSDNRLSARARRFTTRSTTTGRRRGYKILKEIGRGGNGVVYLASIQDDDARWTSFVVLKEPHDRYKTKLEVGLMESMEKSDYMCEFLGAVVDPRVRTWMMMFELCQHGSLRECLQSGSYPRDGEAIHAAINMMMKGVSHVHASKLAHRDIKMENFLISCHCERYAGPHMEGKCKREHIIKISDLGLAKAGNMMFDTSAQLTGTLCYVAPERLNVLPGVITPDSYRLADLYGMGLAIWELLYYATFGEHKRVLEHVVPDEAARRMITEAQMVMMVSTGRMVPSTEWLPPNIRRWLEKCIDFDPKLRFDSLESARRALRDIYHDFITFLPPSLEDDDVSSASQDLSDDDDDDAPPY